MDKLLIFWAVLLVFAALLVFIYKHLVKYQARVVIRASTFVDQEHQQLAMEEQRKLGDQTKEELKKSASKNMLTKIEVGGVNMGDIGYRIMVRCGQCKKSWPIAQLDFKFIGGRLTISVLEHGPGEFEVKGVVPEKFPEMLDKIKEKIELYNYSEVIR